MSTYALVILVVVAVGGVAWVFLYPILSGEKKAERRVASIARTDPVARPQRAAAVEQNPARAGRGHAQGHRGAQQEGEAAAACGAAAASRARLEQATFYGDLRHCRRRRLPGHAAVRHRSDRGARLWLCRRLRPAVLDAVVSQEAPREQIPQRISGCRRRHRARHQGRSAAARQSQADLPTTRSSR